MALTLPANFSKDIQGRDTALVPVVAIGSWDHGDYGVEGLWGWWRDTLFLSTNAFSFRDESSLFPDDPITVNIHPLLLNVPSLKESIDVEKRNYKISNVNLDISNYEYEGKRFSELVSGSLINVECRIFWSSPSTGLFHPADKGALYDQSAFPIYYGTIRRYTHDDEKVRLVVEDRSQSILHKDLPLPDVEGGTQRWLGTGDDVPDKYKNKPIPMVYGSVDRSPCVAKTEITTDNAMVTTVIADPLATNSNFLEALSLYVYDRDYFNINFQIPYTIRSKWGFTETKQYEKEDGKFKFNYRTKSPQGGVPTFFVAKSPLAYGLISVTKIHTPSGVYLLTNSNSDGELIAEDGDWTYYNSFPATVVGEETQIGLNNNYATNEGTIYKYAIQFTFDTPKDKADLIVIERNHLGIPILDDNGEEKILADLTLGMVESTADVDWSCWMFFSTLPTNQKPFSLVIEPRASNYTVVRTLYPTQVANPDEQNALTYQENQFFAYPAITNTLDSLMFEVRAGGGSSTDWGIDLHNITSKLSIDNVAHKTTYLMKDVLEKDFYVDIVGRGNQYINWGDPASFDPSAATAIWHIMNFELEYTPPALDEGDYTHWRYAFTVDEKINSKKLIEGIASTSPYIPRFDNMGNFRFDVIKEQYYTDTSSTGFTDYETIKADDVISSSFSRTKIEEVYTKVVINYKWDYARKEFSKKWEETLPIPSNDMYNLAGYKRGYYGLAEDDSGSTLDIDDDRGKYIRNDVTAKKFAKWMVMWHCNQHLKIKVRLPLKYMYIEIGGIVRFDKIIDVEPYGINYKGDAYFIVVDTDIARRGSLVNGQQVFPDFMVISTNKTLEYCEIECIQMHNLVSDSDYSAATVYGCMDERAWNYNPVATNSGGVCLIPPFGDDGEVIENENHSAFNAEFLVPQTATNGCPVYCHLDDPKETSINFPEDLIEDIEACDSAINPDNHIYDYDDGSHYADAHDDFDNGIKPIFYSMDNCIWQHYASPPKKVDLFLNYIDELWGGNNKPPTKAINFKTVSLQEMPDYELFEDYMDLGWQYHHMHLQMFITLRDGDGYLRFHWGDGFIFELAGSALPVSVKLELRNPIHLVRMDQVDPTMMAQHEVLSVNLNQDIFNRKVLTSEDYLDQTQVGYPRADWHTMWYDNNIKVHRGEIGWDLIPWLDHPVIDSIMFDRCIWTFNFKVTLYNGNMNDNDKIWSIPFRLRLGSTDIPISFDPIGWEE